MRSLESISTGQCRVMGAIRRSFTQVCAASSSGTAMPRQAWSSTG
jgi:hypothetical protein